VLSEQADRYTDLLTAAFQALAKSPKSAPACDHIRQGYRRRNVERHMIYLSDNCWPQVVKAKALRIVFMLNVW
jgi:plasmid stabilization system protein ParE